MQSSRKLLGDDRLDGGDPHRNGEKTTSDGPTEVSTHTGTIRICEKSQTSPPQGQDSLSTRYGIVNDEGFHPYWDVDSQSQWFGAESPFSPRGGVYDGTQEMSDANDLQAPIGEWKSVERRGTNTHTYRNDEKELDDSRMSPRQRQGFPSTHGAVATANMHNTDAHGSARQRQAFLSTLFLPDPVAPRPISHSMYGRRQLSAPPEVRDPPERMRPCQSKGKCR